MNHTEAINKNITSVICHGESETFDLDGTYEVRVTAEYDSDYSINDYDSDGKVSEYSYSYGDRTPRPQGFTGRARKIETDRSSWVWWEPYEELTEAQIVAEMPRIRDLVESGFTLLHVELLSQVADQFGGLHTVTVDDTWMGGNAWGYSDTEYQNEVIGDMLEEIFYNLPKEIA